MIRSTLAQYGHVSELAGRAEDIAAHLVSHALGAKARKFDADGRQSAVDFMLEWPNGRRGALEVTLVTQPESSAWQGMAAKEGWRWPAPSGWEFRLAGTDMPYQRTRRAVLRAVALCDRENVDALDRLPPDIASGDPDLRWLSDIGDLRRTSFKPGVVLLPEVRAEFVEASTSDFTTLVESWLHLPHIPRHIEKLVGCHCCGEASLSRARRRGVSRAVLYERLSATNSEPRRLRRHRRNLGLVQLLASILGLAGWRWHWLDFPRRTMRKYQRIYCTRLPRSARPSETAVIRAVGPLRDGQGKLDR